MLVVYVASKCPPVERYSPADGTWSKCAHMLSPREDAGCAVYLGRIYVAGGKDELNLKLCGAERFDPDAARWTPVKRMRSKRDDVSRGSVGMKDVPPRDLRGEFIFVNDEKRKETRREAMGLTQPREMSGGQRCRHYF